MPDRTEVKAQRLKALRSFAEQHRHKHRTEFDSLVRNYARVVFELSREVSLDYLQLVKLQIGYFDRESMTLEQFVTEDARPP